MAGLVFCALLGCHMYRPGHGNLADDADAPIQKLIEQRLAEQRKEKPGPQRLAEYNRDRYQRPQDLEPAPELKDLESRREAVAAKLVEAGPLELPTALAFALEFNQSILAGRSAIEAVGGDELIARSRFLPHLYYDLEQRNLEKIAGDLFTDRRDQFFRLTQVLAEWGKDNPRDIVLRENQREALFVYEDTVRRVLSDLRLRFFTVLLRQRQLAERMELLGEFRAQHERIVRLYERKQVAELDVLTARLNMLNEETRINALQREILRQELDLLDLLGFPVGTTDLALAGELESLELAPESAVNVALMRSTSIAQARAEVMEQRRKARQVLWEYGPDIRAQGGWKGSRGAAGLELFGLDGLYQLSTFAEQHVDRPDAGFLPVLNQSFVTSPDFRLFLDEDVLAAEQEGWFLNLLLEVPIFQGFERRGKYIRELARLKETRHLLGETIDEIEVEVLKAYQSLLETREEMRILAETVSISKKRLDTMQRLKELGRISDDELETFRDRFFQDQDVYFVQQIQHVQAQEQLRFLMRYFDDLPEPEPQGESVTAEPSEGIHE